MRKNDIFFLKDQINVNNNNRENDVKAEVGVKTEDGAIICNLHHKYIGDKYKSLNAIIFKYRIMDDALNLTSFEDQQPDLTNIVSTYIKKNIDVNDRLFKFEKSIKHLKDIDNKHI